MVINQRNGFANVIGEVAARQDMPAGTRVRITPEWLDSPDSEIVYVVLENNGDRLLIEAQTGARLQPTEIVRPYMIELA